MHAEHHRRSVGLAYAHNLSGSLETVASTGACINATDFLLYTVSASSKVHGSSLAHSIATVQEVAIGRMSV